MNQEMQDFSRDLSWRLFMNGIVLQSMARHRTYRGQQVRENVNVQGNNAVMMIAGIIELLFWLFVMILFGGTMLMSLCGLMMIVFGIE